MKEIVVIYHAYFLGDLYMSMINEQFALLKSSGLHDVYSKLHIGVVDPASRKKDIVLEIPKAEVVIYPENKEETETLKWVRDYAAQNPGKYLLYFHTKGISRISPATESWRRYMEYFVIENWTDCVQKLDEGYDCCGVEWTPDCFMGHFPHFSGNFWWSTTDYINTLDHSYLDNPNRLYREFWIGSNPKVKQFEFHHRGGNPYALVYDRSKYVKT
jgi:hypothetical protein